MIDSSEVMADAAAALDHAHRQVIAAEIAVALSIAELCDAHRVTEEAAVEGAEQWIRCGAPGTPMVGEFLAGEIAGILGVSTGSALLRMAEVLNIRHRHPALWAELLAGRMRLWEAGRVAREASAAQLDEAACERFDRLCAVALRTQPWSRVRRNVTKWLIRVDPVKARERQEARARERYARVGRIEDGHLHWWGQLDAADGLALDEALNRIAGTIDGVNQDHRRATALGMLARHALGIQPLPTEPALPTESAQPTEPGQPTQPATPRSRRAEMVVHVDAADLTDPATGVADLDRWGAVLADQLATLLTDSHVTVRPIINPAALGATDGYRVPDRMRRTVEVRNPFDVFPYGVRPSWACDLDHTAPFDHADPKGRGQTRPDNLGPLSRFSHRLKTHGGWDLRQPGPGVFEWRSPLGYHYRVTPDGTVMTGRPGIRRRWVRRARNWPDLIRPNIPVILE